MAGVSYPENIQDMIDDFQFLEDWEDRYMHVIDMGKSLPALSDAEKSDGNKVKGCASQVWLITDKKDGTYVFRGDSDAHIVKGLVAIVLEIFSGRSATEIQSLDAKSIFIELGLSEHLSTQRANGLASMVSRIQAEVSEQPS